MTPLDEWEAAERLGRVDACRSAPGLDEGPAAGIHLLNAHSGKGQEFDWVIAVRLEEKGIPHSLAVSDAAVDEELRVLHVMVSRAKEGLILTRSKSVTNAGGTFMRAPSRWLDVLRPTVTAVR